MEKDKSAGGKAYILICGLACILLTAQSPGQSAGNCVLSLDSRGGSMRAADSQSLQSFTNAITIEVWLKAASFHPDEGFISSLVRKNVASGTENFLLRFRNIGGSPRAQMGLGRLGTLDAPSEFAVNNWYHLAGTYDGRAITVFVNGLAVASQNTSGGVHIDQSDLHIGKGDPASISSGEYFHGALDEIRLWNVARSQEQIQAAMNTSLSGKEEGLVAYWNFDDGTTKDLSGHGNDGILDGDARIVESPRPAAVAPKEKQAGKLIAWWKLDETGGSDVGDSSGNGHTGKLVGNPQWQPAGGKVGGALSFDGAGDFVQIGDEPAFDLAGPITVAAWIKVNSFDKRWQAIVTKGDTTWRLQRFAQEDTVAFHCTGIASITGQRPEGIEGKKSLNDGQWHHVVGVYDGATISLYIDGVLDNSSKASGAIQMNDSAVVIGGNSEQSDREWNGLIDEVCIVSGAVDANGVRALYARQDPAKVAQTAIIALAASQAPPRAAAGVAGEGIVGDWQTVSSQAIIQVRKKSDGALAAAVVGQSADPTAPTIPLDEVTFENRTFRFKMISNQADFEGTMNEDGSSIEGQFRQQGQTRAVTLARIKPAPASTEAAPAGQDVLQAQTRGTSRAATAVILVLVLAGVIAAVVLFLVRSSIRR